MRPANYCIVRSDCKEDEYDVVFLSVWAPGISIFAGTTCELQACIVRLVTLGYLIVLLIANVTRDILLLT